MENTANSTTTDSVASVGVPSVADLAKVSSDAGGGMNGILMAIIALLGGGGAIWKYLQNKEKSKVQKEELAHEERMKELEIKSAKASNAEEELAKCKAEKDSLQDKLNKAELKLAKTKLTKNS